MSPQTSPDLPENHAVGFISARNLLRDDNLTASELIHHTESPGFGQNQQDAFSTELNTSLTSEFEFDSFSNNFSHVNSDDEVFKDENDHSPDNS